MHAIIKLKLGAVSHRTISIVGAGKLYTLDTPYGSKDELVDLLKQLKAAGIIPMADIVINHRCAQEQDESGVWNSFSCALQPPSQSLLLFTPRTLSASHIVCSCL